MAGVENISSKFSPCGEYLAHLDLNGHLKILATLTGKVVSDYKPTKLEKATCTCLRWGPGRRVQAPEPPSKKKKRKSGEQHEELADTAMVAVGSGEGSLVLYNIEKHTYTPMLSKGHSKAVTDMCWQADGRTLYSSSMDGHVCVWNVSTLHMTEKWKATSGRHHGVQCLCLCSSSRLLTADHTIKMWDIATKDVLQEFSGHSTEVIKLLPVLKSSWEQNDSGDSNLAPYVFSVAIGDKTINVWRCDSESSQAAAISSFEVQDEPSDLSMILSKKQKVRLAVLTKQGSVAVLEQTLNGKLDSGAKLKTVVRLTSAHTKGETAVPILAAAPLQGEQSSLVVMHGSHQQPVFETVVLRPRQGEMKVQVSSSDAGMTQRKKADVNSQTESASATESKSKRKRTKSSERTIEERLEALEVKKSTPPATKAGKNLSKEDQLVDQLTQGLQNQDTDLLSRVLDEKRDDIIKKSVKRLPPHVLQPLVSQISQRLHAHPASGVKMVRWMKHIMQTHASSLVARASGLECVRGMVEFIQCRQHALQRRTGEQGQMQLLLARIATQTSSSEDEASAPADQGLVYQDDWSDEGMDFDTTMVEFGASESEDNWGEMD